MLEQTYAGLIAGRQSGEGKRGVCLYLVDTAETVSSVRRLSGVGGMKDEAVMPR